MLLLSRRAQCAGGSSALRTRPLGPPRAPAKPAPPAAAADAAQPQGGEPADADTTPLIRSTRAPRRKSSSSSSASNPEQQQRPRGSAASVQKRRAAEEAERFASAAAAADPKIAALRGRLVRRSQPELVSSGAVPAAALDVGVLGAGKERYYAIAVAEGKEERYCAALMKRARSGVAGGALAVPPAPSVVEAWRPSRAARVYVPNTDSLSKTAKIVPYGGGGWVFVRCVMDTAAANAIAQTPNFMAFRGAQSWDAALLRAAGALDYFASAADERAGKLSPPPPDLRVEGQAGAAKGAVILPEPSSNALVAAVKAWEAEADPARGGAALEEGVEARRREVYGDAGGTIFGVTAEEGRAAAEAQRREAAAAGRGGGRGGRGLGGGRGGRGADARGRGGRFAGAGQEEDGGGGGGRWSSSAADEGEGQPGGYYQDDRRASSSSRRVRTPPGDRPGADRRRSLGDGARYDAYSFDRDMGSDRYGGDSWDGGGGGEGGGSFGGGGGAAAARGGRGGDEATTTAYPGGGGAAGGGDPFGDALYMGDELFASDGRAGRYADEGDYGGGAAGAGAASAVPTPPGDRGADRRRALGDGARFDPYSLDRDTASDRYSSEYYDDGYGGGGYQTPPERPSTRGQQPKQQQQRQRQQPAAAAAAGRGSDPLGDALFGGAAHAEDGGRYYDGGKDYDGGEDPGEMPRVRGGAWYGDGSGDEEGWGGDGGGVSSKRPPPKQPKQQQPKQQQQPPGRGGGGNIGSDALGDALFGLDYVDGGYRGVDLDD